MTIVRNKKKQLCLSTSKVKLLGLRLMPVTEKFFVHPVISEYIFILFISFYQEMVVVKRWVLPPTLWTIGTGIHYYSSVHGHSNPLPQFSAVRNSNPRRQFSALRHSNRLLQFSATIIIMQWNFWINHFCERKLLRYIITRNLPAGQDCKVLFSPIMHTFTLFFCYWWWHRCILSISN